jgi:nucleotide-binding universal stress UspA family protein
MYKDILLAVDLNHPETQEKATRTATEYAKAFGSKLHVLTVVPDFGMSIVSSYFPEDFARKAEAEASAQLHAYVKEHVPDEVSVQHIVAYGSIYSEILEFAEKTGCDLIVLASHRPELKDYLIGPNAARVMRHANCSVLIVRDEGSGP